MVVQHSGRLASPRHRNLKIANPRGRLCRCSYFGAVSLLILLSSTLTGHLEFLKHPVLERKQTCSTSSLLIKHSAPALFFVSRAGNGFPISDHTNIVWCGEDKGTAGPDYSLDSGKSRSLLDNQLHSCKIILTYPLPLAGFLEGGSVVQRAHFATICITPLHCLRSPRITE